MVFEKGSIERTQLAGYGDMVKGSLQNKGVIFILLIFLALCALSFAIGYYKGFHSVVCPVCKLF